MRYVALVAAALLWSSSAVAQHKHSTMKGPNGGPMADVAGVHAELAVAGNTVTINLFDETNKPVSSKGFSGSALIVSDEALSRETGPATEFIVVMSGEPQGGIKIRRRDAAGRGRYERLMRRGPYGMGPSFW